MAEMRLYFPARENGEPWLSDKEKIIQAVRDFVRRRDDFIKSNVLYYKKLVIELPGWSKRRIQNMARKIASMFTFGAHDKNKKENLESWLLHVDIIKYDNAWWGLELQLLVDYNAQEIEIYAILMPIRSE